ncbi:MAG TPA: hypothetical protein VNX25_06985 [Verrucomicrobiae bacterium]|nr:hypothetical protein [Verrucomicrobiae bacterium]
MPADIINFRRSIGGSMWHVSSCPNWPQSLLGTVNVWSDENLDGLCPHCSSILAGE